MLSRCVSILLVLALAGALSAGCSAFRISVEDRDPRASDPLSAKYDQDDLLSLAELTAEALRAHPFPPADEDQPILVEMGIQNRTETHIDMQALSNTITTHLLDTKTVRFVNSDKRDALLREQGYQLKNCTPETRAAIGKQLGARYMLTGSLIEIERESGRQARVSKQQDVYYQLTVEITDLETGLIAVRKQRDRLRRAGKPLLGW
jgi:penicillin-binding protein activator